MLQLTTATELLADLRQRGADLDVSPDGVLHVRNVSLSVSDREAVKTLKPELIAALQGEADEPPPEAAAPEEGVSPDVASGALVPEIVGATGGADQYQSADVTDTVTSAPAPTSIAARDATEDTPPPAQRCETPPVNPALYRRPITPPRPQPSVGSTIGAQLLRDFERVGFKFRLDGRLVRFTYAGAVAIIQRNAEAIARELTRRRAWTRPQQPTR